MPLSGAYDLHLRGIPGAVRILPGPGGTRTRDVLRRVLDGWPHTCRPVISGSAASPPDPLFLVEPLDDGAFLLHGASPEATDFTPFRPGDSAARLRPGYSHEPTLACLAATLVIELVAVHEARAHRQMGLHAAAASRDGQTLLFCGRHRAGKSVLVARLQLAGWQGLGDDMVGLTADGELISYALAPRLRLPLPSCPGLAPLREPDSPFVACQDDRYLCCDPAALPRQAWGTPHPVEAVMVLDRREETDGRSGIFLQPRQDDMSDLLRRFLLRDGRAGLALRTVDALLRRVPCRVLRYRTADEALALLNGWLDARRAGRAVEDPPLDENAAPAFSGAQAPAVAQRPGRGRRPRVLCRRDGMFPARQTVPRTEAVRHVRFRQRPDVIFRQDATGGGFLARDEEQTGRDGRIFLLNVMGCVLWQLWREPADDAELTALLTEAFPHIPPEQIRKDVTALRRRLCVAGLLIAVDAAPASV